MTLIDETVLDELELRVRRQLEYGLFVDNLDGKMVMNVLSTCRAALRYRKALEKIKQGYTEVSNCGRFYELNDAQEIAREALSEGEPIVEDHSFPGVRKITYEEDPK